MELAYPCQAAETALELKKQRQRVGASPPSSDLKKGPGSELLDAAQPVLTDVLVMKDKDEEDGEEHFKFGSLTDVGEDWLEPPLSKDDEGMNVDADQELFYMGSESPYFSQLSLAMLMRWSDETALRVLRDGDAAVQASLKHDFGGDAVLPLLEAALDRGDSDRLETLCSKLGDEPSREQLEQLLLATSSSDAYTRTYAQECGREGGRERENEENGKKRKPKKYASKNVQFCVMSLSPDDET